jgi:hypothetical protein
MVRIATLFVVLTIMDKLPLLPVDRKLNYVSWLQARQKSVRICINKNAAFLCMLRVVVSFSPRNATYPTGEDAAMKERIPSTQNKGNFFMTCGKGDWDAH